MSEENQSIKNSFYRMYKENIELLEIINKAKQFIKENACYDKETKKCNDDLNYNECDELLGILGGINE